MSERGRDERFRLCEPADGAFRVFPDEAVQQDGSDEWISVSRHSATVGEMLLLDVVQVDPLEGEIRRRLTACVVESCPVIVDGDMRHRIRLGGDVTAPVLFEQQVRRG